jgi:hypothetical protein
VNNELNALIKLGFVPEYGVNCRVLTESAETESDMLPTRNAVEEAMSWLTEDAKEGDVLWFHFSGHGIQDFDHPSAERDGVDEALLPLDYQTAGNISDKTIHELLVKRLPKGATLYAVIDSCHSGDMMDMRYVYGTQTFTYTHSRTHIHTHTHTQTCTHARTHIYTRTHTHIYS